jgi:hypothetical protein
LFLTVGWRQNNLLLADTDVMLVAVVCREKKEVSNEIALFYVAGGFIDGSASGCSNRATATISSGAGLNRLKTL